ncbi:MAG: ADP-ribose pyrophosphatase [Patescibacteria group bacterium]|nr:NUDIX hydrolase [Candidatus Saccharibacteria bacterium]MDQ5962984.1 ADP-ribose pyrophosphatase [Patescibacteria group bacterium]
MQIDWERIEPTNTEKVAWRTIVTKHFRLPDGTVHEYGTKDAENGHCVATVALTATNEVILARQFRPGPEKIFYELPGGESEDGEQHIEAAKRELLEETGYQVGQIVHVGDCYKDAYTNTIWHYFLATNCTPHAEGQQTEATEFIQVELVSIDGLMLHARQAEMTDVEGVFLAYDKLMELKNGG